jgi:hypothetical protein
MLSFDYCEFVHDLRRFGKWKASPAMSELVVTIVLALAFGSFYLLARNPATTPVLVKKYPTITLFVILGAALLLIFVLRLVIVVPCLATTRSHTVTDNLGRFYSTEYKDSGEWCLWVRGTT